MKITEIDKDIKIFMETEYGYLKNIENDIFEIQIQPEQENLLDKNYLSKIIYADNPLEEFYEIINLFYDNSYSVYMDYFFDEFLKSRKLYGEIDEDEKEKIFDYLHDNIMINYPYENYLEAMYSVNIIVDTGDGNYDYTLNCVYPHYNGRIDENINNSASIVWLAKQNGYTKRQLNKALKFEEFYESKFLKSIFQELINCTSHMNALSFFVEMTLKDIIALNMKKEKIKFIKLCKDTKCGLIDTWNGAGGMLDIVLEGDIKIKGEFISSIFPDCVICYGIKDIYGIDDYLWKQGKVLEISIDD